MQALGIKTILIWIAFMGILSADRRLVRRELVCGKYEERYNFIFALMVFLPVILWAGFRDGAGYADTNAYIRLYGMIPTGVHNIFNYIIESQSKDPGFTLFVSVIKSIFGTDYTPFLFITACIQGFIIVNFYRKYSSDFMLSMFLFIASTEYYSWIFNGMRQFLAVTVALAGFQLYFDKKYLKYFFVILLASSIHMSAIIMLPIAFVARGIPWNKKTILTIGIALLAVFATEKFTDLLGSAVQYTQYADSTTAWIESSDDGANPIRVLVHAMPTILAFLGRDYIRKADNPIINISVNMSIIATSLWVISMMTSGIYLGRLPIYASLFNYILLPYQIKHLFTEQSIKTTCVIVIVLYLAYYYYQFHFTWGII